MTLTLDDCIIYGEFRSYWHRCCPNEDGTVALAMFRDYYNLTNEEEKRVLELLTIERSSGGKECSHTQQ